MIGWARDHATALAGAVLLWLIHDLSGSSPELMVQARPRPLSIDRSALEVHEVDRTARALRDPCRPAETRAAAGADDSSPGPPADATPEQAPPGDPSGDAPSGVTGPPPLGRPFVLELEATLFLGGSPGRARISGRDVGLHDTIPGLDEAAPPRLVELDGTRAVVSHRGARYLLDLHASPAVTIDPSAPPEVEDASP